MISVTRILQAAGLYDFSKVPADILSAACKFGTASHRATELDDLGTLDMDTLSAPLLPRLEAWRKFKADFKLGPFLAIEKEFISAKWGFCGHPDRVYQVNKAMVDIYDIKTTEQANPVMGLQTGGYQILVEENLKLKVRNRWVVLLGDGIYKIEPHKEKSDSHIFLCILQEVLWRKGHLK